MKKSTLITTIAMIVVVVVALSTATYAWFTSNAVTTATVQMQTSATSHLSLTVVKDVKDDLHTWADGETGIGIGLTGNSGLWAPQAALTNSLPYTASTLSGSGNAANFYTANFVSNNKATQAEAATSRGLDAIRVTNITGDTLSTVYLYVIVAVDGGAANSNNLYAAQATSFYITYDGEDTDTDGAGEDTDADKGYATNGYGLGTAAEYTYIKATSFDAEIAAANGYYYDDNSSKVNTTQPTSENFAGKTYYTRVAGFAAGAEITSTDAVSASGLSAQANFGGTGVGLLTSRPNYDGQTTGGFLHASADRVELGITAGQYVLAYRVALGSIASNKSLTVGVYNWIDGWYADNAAGNAAYTVTYAFTDTELSISTQA